MSSAIGRGVVAGIAGAIAIDLYLIVVQSWIMHLFSPIVISQWDASNTLGRAAFDGGIATALLGFGMHLVVSSIWGIVLALLLRYERLRHVHPLLIGIPFGLIVMVVMRDLIVPLGQAHQPVVHGWRLLNLAVAHTLFFGVPMAYVAKGKGSYSATSVRHSSGTTMEAPFV